MFGSPTELEGRFLEHLRTIESVVAFVARRHGLAESEREELDAEVKAKIVADGYAVFARFRGESSLVSYLAVVVHRVFLDRRRALWGKWRPSAAARRLGGAAVRLEELLERDGFDFEEACRQLRENQGFAVENAQLAEIATKLPLRASRHARELEPVAETLVAIGRSPEEDLIRHEREAVRARLFAALERCIERLEEEDRLIVSMTFVDRLAVAEVARTLRLKQRPLYRRLPRIQQELRSLLAQEGFDHHQVAELLALPEDA